jgi:hypothetical protein
MIKTNYIRITHNDWNTRIYRFIPLDRLVELFTLKHNTLIAPYKWDDPFENILERVIYHRKSDGACFKFPLRDRVYGQCWTLHPDHDAAWRCYLPDKNGAQVTSTIRKLYISLKNAEDRHSLSCFIGRVAYKNESWFLDPFRIARYFKRGGTERHVDTLLWKRKAFRWEKEIRLLYLDPHAKTHGDFLNYDVDPYALISDITFDPRMSEQVVDSYSKVLLEIGFKGKIRQSSLYKAPDLEIPF